MSIKLQLIKNYKLFNRSFIAGHIDIKERRYYQINYFPITQPKVKFATTANSVS